MVKNSERDLAAVLEDVTFIINEIRVDKFKKLEKTKLTPKQEELLDNIEKDLEVCVTKLGKILHTTEL